MWRLASVFCVVSLTALTAALAAQDAPPRDAAADLVRTRCLTCHGDDLIRQQRLTREGWLREVDKMIGWGAPLAEPDRTTVIDYLTRTYGPRPASTANEAAETLLKTRCLVCHDMRLIEQQRLTLPGWTRELDKMIGWGAPLTVAERDRLAAYLAERYTP